MPMPKEIGKCTYSDYITWPENERWEIYNGTPYLQAAPAWQHQSISGELYRQMSNYFADKPCKVFAAPFDVCIPEHNEMDDNISTVLQPDIVVVCDETRLRKTGYFGIPSLIVEISSPSTIRNDKIRKFNIYEKAGINEYWIVEQDSKIVTVFTLQGNKRYGRPDYFTDEDILTSYTFPDLHVDFKKVFEGI